MYCSPLAMCPMIRLIMTVLRNDLAFAGFYCANKICAPRSPRFAYSVMTIT